MSVAGSATNYKDKEGIARTSCLAICMNTHPEVMLCDRHWMPMRFFCGNRFENLRLSSLHLQVSRQYCYYHGLVIPRTLQQQSHGIESSSIVFLMPVSITLYLASCYTSSVVDREHFENCSWIQGLLLSITTCIISAVLCCRAYKINLSLYHYALCLHMMSMCWSAAQTVLGTHNPHQKIAVL